MQNESLDPSRPGPDTGPAATTEPNALELPDLSDLPLHFRSALTGLWEWSIGADVLSPEERQVLAKALSGYAASVPAADLDSSQAPLVRGVTRGTPGIG